MRLSRRTLLRATLGATQLGLLSRFAGRAFAAPTGGPTKLLCISIDGGCHWESFFAALSGAAISRFIPAPGGGIRPFGYSPSQVENFDRTPVDLAQPGVRRKIRGPVHWNWANSADDQGVNPASGGTQQYRPWGYSWADPTYRIYERIAVMVGVDQGTAAHDSGKVASMCGVAGATFRAPAIPAVIANAMAARFPDRPLPNVTLGGVSPTSLELPAAAAPVRIGEPSSLASTLSDRSNLGWAGLRARTDLPRVKFDGSAGVGTVPATKVDAALLKAARRLRGRSSRGTDAMLEQMHDTLQGTSKTVARDVVSVLEQTVGFEHLSQNPAYPANWSAAIGGAGSGSNEIGGMAAMGPWDFALRLLKSNLATSVSMGVTGLNQFSFDTHYVGGQAAGANQLRVLMEAVGRMLIELQLTPGSSPGSTLLDETVVYVHSEFGRTFPKVGSDHHPATCAIIAGGTIRGNQMVGGYDETAMGSPLGVPVDLIEEGGEHVTREPRSQDVAATVINAFGLRPGADFFIPGGYGVFDGIFL